VVQSFFSHVSGSIFVVLLLWFPFGLSRFTLSSTLGLAYRVTFHVVSSLWTLSGCLADLVSFLLSRLMLFFPGASLILFYLDCVTSPFPLPCVPFIAFNIRCLHFPVSLLQTIAGLVENWVADYYLAPWPLAGSALSFAARTVNSFWGTAVRS
jgi:hypothetical protein